MAARIVTERCQHSCANQQQIVIHPHNANLSISSVCGAAQPHGGLSMLQQQQHTAGLDAAVRFKEHSGELCKLVAPYTRCSLLCLLAN